MEIITALPAYKSETQGSALHQKPMDNLRPSSREPPIMAHGVRGLLHDMDSFMELKKSELMLDLNQLLFCTN